MCRVSVRFWIDFGLEIAPTPRCLLMRSQCLFLQLFLFQWSGRNFMESRYH
jgi:hypothetical protein